MMKKYLLNNWISVTYLLILILGLSFSFTFTNLWLEENSRKILFKIGVIIPFILAIVWIFSNISNTFNLDKWFRTAIIVIGAFTIPLWAYDNRTAFELERIFIILSFIYILYNWFVQKKVVWHKPNMIFISIGIFVLLRLVGYLWNNDVEHRFLDYETNTIILLLFPLLISLFFKVSHSEKLSFIAIIFKIFLGFLCFNLIFYSFLAVSVDKTFYSFLTFNKSYLPYLEILQWGHFKHPSFIAWIILLVGGLGFLVWKEDKKHITTKEIILYAVLLFFFAFIVQARIVIIGYFLTICFFVWIFLSKGWTLFTKTLTISILSIFAGIALAVLITKTNYFYDPIRIHFYELSAETISQNVWFGNGTLTQKNIAQQVGIEHKQLHNDFLSTMVDLGVVGVFSLFIYIGISLWRGIIHKDNYLVYSILLCILIINVDSLWYTITGMYILFPLIFFIFLSEEK